MNDYDKRMIKNWHAQTLRGLLDILEENDNLSEEEIEGLKTTIVLFRNRINKLDSGIDLDGLRIMKRRTLNDL